MTEALVNTARTIVPLLQEEAPQADKDRRLTNRAVAAIRDAGLFRLMVPRSMGGHEATMRSTLSVTSELGIGCSSAAWVTTILTVGGFLTAAFPEKVRQEVWQAGPDTTICVSTASPDAVGRRTSGGQIISGKWHYASGCHQAEWALLAAPMMDEQDTTVGRVFALIPISELSIEDTWHVAGMRGTGSNTLVAHDLFVSDERLLSWAKVIGGRQEDEHDDESLYRIPLVSVLSLTLLGPMLGTTKAAFNLAIETAKKKPMALSSYQRLADSPSVQLAIADAAVLIDTAELHIFRATDDLDRAAQQNVQRDIPARARTRMDSAYAAKCLREAMSLMLNVTGAGSFADVNPLQRLWRDLETASRHASVNLNLNREVYGRALLDVAETATIV
jgi:alkylation response protein AidB-like acyl-CoA dehydrogenase